MRQPLRAAAVAARYLGAAALLAVGLDHLEQYSAEHYSAIPTIGTLFALNFVSAALIAGALAAPVQRLPGRAGQIAMPLLSAGGIAVAAGSPLSGLLLSESTGLFGFMEVGYRPAMVPATPRAPTGSCHLSPGSGRCGGSHRAAPYASSGVAQVTARRWLPTRPPSLAAG